MSKKKNVDIAPPLSEDPTIGLVDSHCHLDMLKLEKYQGDLSGVLNTANGLGVKNMLCVAVNLEDWPNMMNIVEQHDQVVASVGVHPCYTEVEEPDADRLVELAKHDKVVAIGETGLDYFRMEGDLEWQRDRFRRHIAAGKQTHLPLIIHTRHAKADTIKVLDEESARDTGGVMHCFAEDWETAKAAMDMDFYISFSGIVTFKSAVDLHEVAKQVPLDRMLVEADSPYLAPVPLRGRQNEPGYTRYVAEFIANLRGESLETIAQSTTSNFKRLFSKAA